MNAFQFKSNKLFYIFFQIFCRLVNVKIFWLETLEQLRQETQVGWYYMNYHALIMPQDVGKRLEKLPPQEALSFSVCKPVYCLHSKEELHSQRSYPWFAWAKPCCWLLLTYKKPIGVWLRHVHLRHVHPRHVHPRHVHSRNLMWKHTMHLVLYNYMCNKKIWLYLCSCSIPMH